ncbi:MAG: anthrone oxygenase family protein [Acidobacteriaceae bacterium]
MNSTWTIKTWELISILCSALVAGMFHGPWAAISRSLKTFSPEVFLAVVERMNRNMAPLMTVLMPATVLSIVPVLFYSYRSLPRTFYLNAIALALFLIALLVTVLVEVPIVEKLAASTPESLPSNWQQLRDRWMNFHLVRVITGLTSLVLLLVAALF